MGSVGHAVIGFELRGSIGWAGWGRRDFAILKSDGVVLIDPDNTRSVVEFTSVGQGAASGRISFFTYLGDRLGLSANR